MLRAGLLSGRMVTLAGDVDGVLRSALSSLGAELNAFPLGELDDAQAEEWVRSRAPVHALVAAVRGAELSAAEPLESALDRTWTAIHAVAAGALISQEQAGKIVLLGPAPDGGGQAPALRAAVENLARTLSVEWARYGVSVTALTPGKSTSAEQLATVVAFLLSPAGDYFSGCRLELGAIGA